MPEILASHLTREHGQELLRLEREELLRLRAVYDEARREILGRLTEVNADTFTAQHLRVAQVQIEQGIRSMIKKLETDWERRLDGRLERSIDQVITEISYWDKTFRGGASGRIQLDALRRVSAPRGLLLNQYQTSIRRYGLNVIGETQRRLGVHLAKRSGWRDMAIDVAGRLKTHGIAGARWRADRIVRTELAYAMNAGHQAALGASAEVIEGLKQQWDATLDARTSDLCDSLNGQVREIGKPWHYNGRDIMAPPAHPHCRSRTLPWTEEWAAEESERESNEGPRAGGRSQKPVPRAKRTEDVSAKTRRARIHAAEDSIRRNEYETAIVFDADANEILRKKGDRSSVSFTRPELHRMKGRVVTHNHPSSSSFSPQDIALASRWQLAEMRATSRLYDHSMRPPTDRGWSPTFWARVVEPILKEEQKTVLRILQERINQGKIRAVDASRLHWHMVWLRVARRTGLRYRRRKVR